MAMTKWQEHIAKRRTARRLARHAKITVAGWRNEARSGLAKWYAERTSLSAFLKSPDPAE